MLFERFSDFEPDSSETNDGGQERFLSRAEAARYLGVPASTIYHWARTGRLACVLTLGGHMRFSRSALDTASVARRPTPHRSTLPPTLPSTLPGPTLRRPTVDGEAPPAES